MIFKFNKIAQIGIVVKDLEKSMKLYWENLGIGPWNILTYAPPTLTEATFYGKPSNHVFRTAEAMVGDVCVELMHHLEGETIYKEFLAKRGEGLHHILYMTDNIKGIIEECERKGIRVIQSGKVGDQYYCYLDTESTLGIIVELADFSSCPPPERIYPPR